MQKPTNPTRWTFFGEKETLEESNELISCFGTFDSFLAGLKKYLVYMLFCPNGP